MPSIFTTMPQNANRRRPVEYYTLQEPRGEGTTVGTFAGMVISERVIDTFGQCYRYVGIAPRLRDGRYDVDALRPGEWLVEPGLIYAREPRAPGSRSK